ncbi:hypothetical protein [Mycolicibacterium arseniciresistens]|uniref:Uncharacterized protein n=1 Tax=Mycolicibacterium arseniciresistens TaxID=3062257 RepID=A0ABT8U9S3_9MYCO|nr:hypothetical protein [Mycolicibacterium arseniciresistens]MDO3634536.1 hypothetical protein [Mycolicibacterium arseniciresistens]
MSNPIDADPRRRKSGNVAGTVALLVLHVLLALLFFVLSFGIAMSIDSCAYVECGDEKWIGVAMFLAIYGNVAVLLVDVVVSTVFLAKRRRTVVVPALGCVVHAALIIAAFQIAALAGPVSGS